MRFPLLHKHVYYYHHPIYTHYINRNSTENAFIVVVAVVMLF